MREGPLADLFRSTEPEPEEETGQHSEDAGDEVFDYEGEIADPPEPPARPERPARPEAETIIADDPPAPPREPEPELGDVAAYRTDPEEPAYEPPEAKERLRTVFSHQPQADEPDGPMYGREQPRRSAMDTPSIAMPTIRVVGVGGAGVNAINRMIEAEIPGIEYLAVNTDLQSLQQTTADVTVHIGNQLTRGLGSGSDPSLGFKAAFEEQDRIKRLLKGSDLVFVAAGAGGGTGTGAAPVIARLARDVGALTVGIVTKPFGFEGTRRSKQADDGIEALASEVDTLIVIPNERLLSVLARNTSMIEAFRVADDVLRQGVQGVAELVTLPGLINLDFADVRTTMRDAGQALLGIGMGTGDNRAVFAAERAVSSPLLETSVDGARSILLSITGGPDLSLIEVSEAARVVQEAAHPDANIIFGANVDDDLSEQVWVTVIATRFDRQGRRRDGSSKGLDRDIVRPSGRRSHTERQPGSGTKDREGRPRDLNIDVPEFIPSQ
ncbi:MAG TPA: cell division protein FtsZ [Solirubrobacterales bacterium]